MKSVIKTAREYGAVEVLDIDFYEDLLPTEVLVEVKAAAICGSDIHTFEYIPSSHFISVPVILGHEFSGVVLEVGSAVREFSKNDRVMGESNLYCGKCENCRVGNTNVCDHSLMRGLTIDGVMSERVIIDEKFLHKIPKNVSFNDAAVAQPCSVVLHGMLDNSVVEPGDNVVVFGPGIMGNVAAQTAQIKGAGRVLLVGTNADVDVRLYLAQKVGISVFNAEENDLLEHIKMFFPSGKVDVVIECSGSPVAFRQGTKIVKKNGVFLILGIYPNSFEVDLTSLVRKEVNLITSYTSTWKNYEQALNLLSLGLIRVDLLCREYEIGYVQLAFSEAIEKKVLKPILVF